MGWVRQEKVPEKYRTTLIVDSRQYPELASFLWSLPWGEGNERIRDILNEYVLNGGSIGATQPSQPQPRQAEHQQPARHAAQTAVVPAPAGPAVGRVAPARYQTPPHTSAPAPQAVNAQRVVHATDLDYDLIAEQGSRF